MAWSIFKIACRVYGGVMAGVLLVYLCGQALTGGLRIEATTAHMMSPFDAFWMMAWLVAIIVTAVAKAEA